MVPSFLSSHYPLKKHIFFITSISLRSIGFYPESPLTNRLLLWAGFNFTLLFYGCYAELYYGIHYLSIDVLTALDALCPVASSIMSLIKIFFIWFYRREFAELIQRIRVLTAVQNTPEKIAIKQQHFILATRLPAVVLFFSSCTTLAYSFRPLVVNTLRYLNGQEFEFETPFKMMFPAPLLSMPIYPLTYIMVAWHGFATGISFTGVDALFLGFCLYITALLKCLREDLKLVLGATTNYDDDECFSRLTQIIDRHNEIYEMVQKFSKIVVAITLGHFVTSSMIICMSIIDLLLNSGYGVVVYVVYTCAVLTELFLFCYGGSEVIESSEAIGTIAYSSHWYSRDIRIQKMVLLLIERSQRPFDIQVPFFSPTMPVLASILRFTGSLIALAKTIV